MDNSILKTSCLLVTLQRENCTLQAGLCLSTSSPIFLKTAKDFLHPDEKSYFLSLCHRKRQESYLIGRYCAKKAINVIDGTLIPSSISITNGIFHQPIVTSVSRKNIQVSISHTDYIAAAVAFPEEHPMAIDIEVINADKVSVIESQLTTAERQFNISPYCKFTQYTMLWTIKEALSKVLRCGLLVPFEILEVELLKQYPQYTISYFKQFHQYQALSFIINNTICSIVCPKKTKIILDILSIQKKFEFIQEQTPYPKNT